MEIISASALLNRQMQRSQAEALNHRKNVAIALVDTMIS